MSVVGKTDTKTLAKVYMLYPVIKSKWDEISEINFDVKDIYRGGKAKTVLASFSKF